MRGVIDRDTVEWLTVWVNGVGMTPRTVAVPAEFVHRMLDTCRHALDAAKAERLTTPQLRGEMDELSGEATEAVLASLPPPLWTRFTSSDPAVQVAVVAAISLWLLDGLDALTLPRGDVSVWRYKLAWTASQAAAPAS